MSYKTYTPKLRVLSVRLYDFDTGENYGDFECFHQVTEFLNSNDLSVIKLKEYPDIKHQEWGLRRWEQNHQPQY